jgi:hypothetical protein
MVSVLAALAAVWYAEQTVLETRALRREERVARLIALLAEVGEAGSRWARGQGDDNLLKVARSQLKTALRSVGEPFPNSERFLDVEWRRYIEGTDAMEKEAEAFAALDAALNEVASLLGRLRGQGSSHANYWS